MVAQQYCAIQMSTQQFILLKELCTISSIGNKLMNKVTMNICIEKIFVDVFIFLG